MLASKTPCPRCAMSQAGAVELGNGARRRPPRASAPTPTAFC